MFKFLTSYSARILATPFVVLGLTVAIAGPIFSPVLAAAIPVIFDTDMSGDCDDAGALALLHFYADNGEAEILAIGCEAKSEGPGNKIDLYSPGCIDAINHYYGRPNIPIGRDTTRQMEATQRYTKTLAMDFPNDIKGAGTSVPSGVSVYRKALASRPNGSVLFISVGGAPLLQQLLESKADQHSTLTGKQLVEAKVSKLSLMMTWLNGNSEYNTKIDPAAAKYVFDNWPTPIVITDANLGGGTNTGAGLGTKTPAANPVRKAYEIYCGSRLHNASWDLMATLYAIRGGESWFELDPNHQDGHVNINSGDGTSTWNKTTRTNSTYLRWKTGTSNPWIGVAAEMDAGITTAPKLRAAGTLLPVAPRATNQSFDVALYTVSGVRVFAGTVSGSDFETVQALRQHLPSLAPGIYLARMSIESKMVTQPLLIK